jgi:hypothetical protein
VAKRSTKTLTCSWCGNTKGNKRLERNGDGNTWFQCGSESCGKAFAVLSKQFRKRLETEWWLGYRR